MQAELLTLIETAEMCNCGVSTVRRGWYGGTFPKPIRLGRRAIRWRRSDLEQWLENQPLLPQPPRKMETLT
jgi:prophage regulatory protein